MPGAVEGDNVRSTVKDALPWPDTERVDDDVANTGALGPSTAGETPNMYVMVEDTSDVTVTGLASVPASIVAESRP